MGDSKTYNINELDKTTDYNKVYYKDRWIKEDLSRRKTKEGAAPLEQHAQELINSGKYKQRPKNQNDPHRFISHDVMTEYDEMCSRDVAFLNTDVIYGEENMMVSMLNALT